LQAVRNICDENNLALIVDEVQTGAGRTGDFLAFMHAGIKPDVVTMAKGLGGGLPIGACLCAEKLAPVMSAGTHGSTFGGNPVACAGANVVLERLLSPGFLNSVTQKGDYITQRISSMPDVKQVRGRGMMLGIELKKTDARKVAEQCLENGLLVLTAKTLLRLLPPLTITYDEIDKGLSILNTVLKGVANV
jgi:acetylornithine/N-succinyldiaminopimelate aminotransferase